MWTHCVHVFLFMVSCLYVQRIEILNWVIKWRENKWKYKNQVCNSVCPYVSSVPCAFEDLESCGLVHTWWRFFHHASTCCVQPYVYLGLRLRYIFSNFIFIINLYLWFCTFIRIGGKKSDKNINKLKFKLKFINTQ